MCDDQMGVVCWEQNACSNFFVHLIQKGTESLLQNTVNIKETGAVLAKYFLLCIL